MRKSDFLALCAALALAAPGPVLAADCGAGMPDQVYAAYVKTAQLELNLHGYDAGMPDGHPTPKLESAVRDYQQDAQLPVDGCISQSLVDHLQFVLPKIEKARNPGSQPAVAQVQKLLMQRGYYMGAVDGMNGTRTREAVRRFEQDAKLPVAGKADDALVEKIKSADPSIRGDKSAP